jgi:hypothetical protein
MLKLQGMDSLFTFAIPSSCVLVCQSSHTVYWMPVMANWAGNFWLKSFCLDDKSRKSFKLCMCKKSYHVSQIQQVKTLIRSITIQWLKSLLSLIFLIARFPRPILHGLCTFGYATRAVIQLCCGGEPTLLQSVQGRFLLHVFPGETLVTEIWQNKKESVYVQSSILTSIIVEYCLFCVFEFINVDYILCSTFHFFDKITWVLFHKLKFYDCFTWSIALLGVSFRQFDFVLQSLCIRATFKVKVKERGKVVLSGTVRLHPRGSRLWTVLTCSSWAHKVFLTPRHFDIPEGFD